MTCHSTEVNIPVRLTTLWQGLRRVAVSAVAAVSVMAMPAAQAADKGLLIWINADKGHAGLQKVGDDYTKKTGIPVKVEFPDDAPMKFQEAAKAGGGPDIWIWPHDRIGEWIKLGVLTPVTPSNEVKNGIVPIAWDAFTTGGKVWGYPMSVEAVGLIYNKALVKKPPRSFEEIPALDTELQARGAKAILWDYNNTYFTWPLLAANGGYPFFRDTRGNYDAADTGVAKAGAVTGLEMLTDLINKGVMPKAATYAQMEEGMHSGKIAMMINGPWAWDGLRKAKIDFGVAPIPTIKGKPARPFVGVLGAMVNAKSSKKKQAVDFIENYMLKMDGLKKINEDVSLGVPADIALFRAIYGDENISMSMENIHMGKPMPSNPEMGKFWAAMGKALQKATDGELKPAAALEGAAKEITGKELVIKK